MFSIFIFGQLAFILFFVFAVAVGLILIGWLVRSPGAMKIGVFLIIVSLLIIALYLLAGYIAGTFFDVYDKR